MSNRNGIFFTNDKIEQLMDLNIEVSDEWKDFDMAINDPNTPFCRTFVWGPPGIGKTYLAYQRCDNFYAITLSPETPGSELRGHFMPKGQEFVWHDGPVSKSMREGARMVLNEPSHMGSDAMAYLFPVLEGAGTCQMTLPTGETLTAEDGFHIVATDNHSPEELPEEPLRDRWDSRFHLTTYSPMGLEALGEKVRGWAIKVGTTGDDGRWISLRGWGAIDRALAAGWSLDKACKAIFGDVVGGSLYTSLKVAEVDESAGSGVEWASHLGGK